MTQLHGLDVSASDLAFAVQTTTPPQYTGSQEGSGYRLYTGVRWEDLEVTVQKGGLEIFNEEFVDVECIVSTEVLVNFSRSQ
jgi:small RNA 2'-O-methyltransferase